MTYKKFYSKNTNENIIYHIYIFKIYIVDIMYIMLSIFLFL